MVVDIFMNVNTLFDLVLYLSGVILVVYFLSLLPASKTGYRVVEINRGCYKIEYINLFGLWRLDLYRQLTTEGELVVNSNHIFIRPFYTDPDEAVEVIKLIRECERKKKVGKFKKKVYYSDL